MSQFYIRNYRTSGASFIYITSPFQCAKEVVFNSPWLVDFAIGLVNSVFNLPDGHLMFFEEFE